MRNLEKILAIVTVLNIVFAIVNVWAYNNSKHAAFYYEKERKALNCPSSKENYPYTTTIINEGIDYICKRK